MFDCFKTMLIQNCRWLNCGIFTNLLFWWLSPNVFSGARKNTIQPAEDPMSTRFLRTLYIPFALGLVTATWILARSPKSGHCPVPAMSKPITYTLWWFNSLLLKMAHKQLIYLFQMVIFHSYVSLPEANYTLLMLILSQNVSRYALIHLVKL